MEFLENTKTYKRKNITKILLFYQKLMYTKKVCMKIV